jgi:protein-glutamine gamma-glutamyltransferase
VRFGFVHRVMTDALATLGILALVLSGQFSRWVSAIVLVGLVLALSVRESWQRHPAWKHIDTVALLGVLAVQVTRVLMDAAVLDVLVEFAAALQIIRLATRKGAAHDQQVIVLALLHLIAGTVLGGGLGYGLCFLGVLVVAPGALVLSHLRREVEGNYRQGARDRTGLPVDVPRILRSRRVVGRSFLAVTCLLSIPIFVFTALLFVLFPRVGLSLLLMNRGHAGRMIGFSGKVDLGEVGVLRSDPTLAMRIELPACKTPNKPSSCSSFELTEPPRPRITLHLRGTALDSYDGRAWTQSEVRKVPLAFDPDGYAMIEPHPSPTDKILRIDLEPIDPPVVFLPPIASGLRFRPRGQLGGEPSLHGYAGAEGEMRYQPIDDRGLKYEVPLSGRNRPTFQRLGGERARYLVVPGDLAPRIKKLAEDWTKGLQTPLQKAQEIERHLRTEYRYDLASPSGRAKQPLDDFLFESKRGHCEFYSTAMAIMLRTVGVPTRNVTGFVGGTYNRFGKFYAVRQGDAHSWVEAYIDEQGWRTFDPTPPSDAAPKSELSGFWAYIRDLLEATSQRWERHVVGYDLNQQVSLLETLTSRRGRSVLSRKWSKPRAGSAIAAFGALAVVGAVAFVYLRLMRKAPKGGGPGASPRSPSALVATQLYERLDAAMGMKGIARSPGVPPLRHAEALQALDHPLADEVHELTDIYLRARFGGEVITEEAKREFEDRVKIIRSTPLAVKS